MGRSPTTKDNAQALFQSLRSAYAATPTNLKIIDLYVVFAVFTAVIQVVYMAVVGSFPFNSSLWCAFLCRDSCPSCLSSYSSEQRKQGIQGFTSRVCFCRLCSMQFGVAFGDYEFPWISFIYGACYGRKN